MHPSSLQDEQILAANIKRLRTNAGLSQDQASTAAKVHPSTWRGWESGSRMPKFWRAPQIARALGVPVASLFDLPGAGRCVAEVVVSDETLRNVRRNGRSASLEAATRLGAALEPVIYAAATGRVPRPGQPARAKPRRTREEVLAGVAAAKESRSLAAELRSAQSQASIDSE